MTIFGVFLIILGLSGIIITDGFWVGVFLIAVGVFLIHEEYKDIQSRMEKNAISEKLKQILEKRNGENHVPANATVVGKGQYKIWYVNDRLNWFPNTYEVAYTDAKKTRYDTSKICLYSIPKDNIYYYAQTGELHTEVTGSGGGSSYSLLTGFHGKIDPIHISTTVHDNRYTQLLYKDKGQDYEFDFAFDDIGVLRRFLPEKDYEVVAKVEAEKQIQQARPAVPKDEKEKLQKAKGLLDAGLITQEEYEQARQKALADLLS